MRWILMITPLLLCGCAVAHRDVMVFGTDTSFGLSVGADPVNAQVANVSIGYKRREAVWMPLLVNGQDSQAFCKKLSADGKTCEIPLGAPAADATWNPKYTSAAKGVSPEVGGKVLEQDTYSVFASFGGDASAGSGRGRVALAQFFATGIAAQRLGSNPSAARLVSTSEIDPEGERAKGKVEAWKEIGVVDAAKHTLNKEVADANTNTRKANDVLIADYVFGGTVEERKTRLDLLEKDMEIFPEYSDALNAALGDKAAFVKALKKVDNDQIADLATNIPAEPK
jgi:hypothetical protein